MTQEEYLKHLAETKKAIERAQRNLALAIILMTVASTFLLAFVVFMIMNVVT